MQATMPTKTNTLGQRPAPKKVIAAICLACGILTTASPAATDKSGVIAGETWTKAMSPIRVVGDITVANLTIEHSVEILFTGNFEFDCPGILRAIGEETDKIWFHGDTGITWKGINFLNSTPGSVMDWCIVQNSAANGIAITDSFPAISNCEIKNNSGSVGGGMDIRLNVQGTLVLSKCTISNNTAATGGGGVYSYTAANSVIRYTDCYFIDNLARTTNGNSGGGGGYFAGTGKFELFRCVFRGNDVQVTDNNIETYYSLGGGLYVGSGTVSLWCSDFQDNTALVSGTGSVDPFKNPSYPRGGGIYVNAGSASLSNCIIRKNIVVGGGSRYGGGCCLAGGTARVENCTIASNTYEGLYRSAGTLTVINSIIYSNNSNGTQVTGTATISYSDVQNGYAGTGNLNVNPILDPVTAKISKFSSCVDAGNPDPAYNDIVFDPPLAWGSYGTARNDMGAHGGPGAALWEYPRDPRPEIISITGSGTHRFGDTITLTASVAGIPPFSYQWSRNGVAVADDPPRVTGAKAATLVILNAGAADAGMYTVSVNSLLGYGSDTSPPPTAPVEISPLWIDLKMFAGVIIQAQPGKTVKVEYSNDLVSWTTLTQLVLPTSPYTYYDTDSPNHPKRFYRAVEVP